MSSILFLLKLFGFPQYQFRVKGHKCQIRVINTWLHVLHPYLATFICEVCMSPYLEIYQTVFQIIVPQQIIIKNQSKRCAYNTMLRSDQVIIQ